MPSQVVRHKTGRELLFGDSGHVGGDATPLDNDLQVAKTSTAAVN